MSGLSQTLRRTGEAAIGQGGSPTVRARKASPDELPELAQLLATAFFDDPVFNWCFPDGSARRRILPGVFRTFIDAYRTLDETYTTDDHVTGAVCAPPGGEPDEARLAALADISGDYAPRAFELSERIEAQHPQEPHYYVLFLATRPALQSRGLGSALLGQLLERCDHDGVPAYLDATSERNKRLYLKHGFEVRGEVRLREGPSFWPMWREPK